MGARAGQKRIKRKSVSLTAKAARPEDCPGVHVLSQQQVEAMFRREAKQLLDATPAQAREKLRRGELRGTSAEAELEMLQFLLGK